MADNIRNGVAILESLWCDDQAYLDGLNLGYVTNANGNDASDTTGISPNQPWSSGRNMVFARPPATFDWGSNASRKTVMENLTPTYVIDGACYEMVAPGVGDDYTLGARGWKSDGTVVGGSSGYQAGGQFVGHSGNQTIRIKQDGDYLFAINLPFETFSNGSTTLRGSNPGTSLNILDLIRVSTEIYVNGVQRSNGTYGTDSVTGGGTWITLDGSFNITVHNYNRFWANAQYTVVIPLQVGDLVNIRVKGLNETYNGPQGTTGSASTGAPFNTKRIDFDTAKFVTLVDDGENKWGSYPAKIYIERLESAANGGPQVFSVLGEKTRTSGGSPDSNFHPNSEQAIEWQTPLRHDTSAYSWSAVSPHQVTIEETGYYQVHLHYRYGQLDDDVDINLGSVCRIYKGGGLMNTNGPSDVRPASATAHRRHKVNVYTDVGGGSGTLTRLDDVGTGNYTGIQKFTAGDVLEFKMKGEGTGYTTNDGKAELSLIKLAADGSYAENVAVFHSGEPSSCLVATSASGTTTTTTNKATTAWNHEAYNATTNQTTSYRIDTGWTTESIDPAAFLPLGDGKFKVLKEGYLLISMVHGSEVALAGTSATDTTFNRGYGYGVIGSSHLSDHNSGSLINIGIEPTGSWGAGNTKIIENTALTFSSQDNIKQYASGHTTAGTMHRTTMFGSSFMGTGVSALDYGVTGTPQPVQVDQIISVWTRGQFQAQYPTWPYSSGTNTFTYYPGALHKTPADDTSDARLVLRLLVPLHNAYGHIAAGNATTSGDLEKYRNVDSTSADLLSAPASLAGDGTVISMSTSAGLSAAAPSLAATMQMVSQGSGTPATALARSSASVSRCVDSSTSALASAATTLAVTTQKVATATVTLETALTSFAGSATRIPQATISLLPAVSVLVGSGQYALLGSGSLLPSDAILVSTDSLNDIIHQNPGTSNLGAAVATLTASVGLARSGSGSLTLLPATLASDGTVYLQTKDATLQAAATTLAASADLLRQASVSLSSAAPTLAIDEAVIRQTTSASLLSAAVLPYGELSVFGLGSGALQAAIASITADLDILRETSNDVAVDLQAAIASITADLDILRETSNDVAVDLQTGLVTFTTTIQLVHTSVDAALSASTATVNGGSTAVSESTSAALQAANTTLAVVTQTVSNSTSAALTVASPTTAGDVDVYRESESAALQAAPASFAATTQKVSNSSLAALTTLEVDLAGSLTSYVQASVSLVVDRALPYIVATTYRQGSGALQAGIASVTADLDILRGDVDANLEAAASSLASSADLIRQATISLLPSVSTTAATLTIRSSGSVDLTTGVVVLTASAALLRQTTSASLQNTAALLSGSGTLSIVITGSLAPLGATLATTTQTAHQVLTAALAPLGAVLAVDADILRETSNDVAVDLQAGIASVTADLDILRETSNDVAVDLQAGIASVTTSTDVLRQAAVALTVADPTTSGDVDVYRESESAALQAAIASVTVSAHVLRQTTTASIATEVASITADLDLLRETSNDVAVDLQAAPATLSVTTQSVLSASGTLLSDVATIYGDVIREGELVIVGGMNAANATLAASGSVKGQITAPLATEVASITADLDLLRETSNDVAVDLQADPSVLTVNFDIVRMSTDANLQPDAISITESTSVIRQGDGPFDRTHVGTIAADVSVDTQTDSITIQAAPATMAGTGLVVHQSSIALSPAPATTAASVQSTYDAQVSLEAASVVLLGDVDRFVFSSVSLITAPAIVVGTSGVVQPPSTNYNITVPNQSYVVYAILD